MRRKLALCLTMAVVAAGSILDPSTVAAQQFGARGPQQVPLPPTGGPRPQGPLPAQQRPAVRPTTAAHPAAHPAARQAPGAPFVLTPRQQAVLDQVLAAWEREGAKVKTMKAPFTRYEYDTVFGKETKSEGVLQYAAVDKGLYRIDKSDGGQKEHWVCDGESIFEFNATKKQLIERPIPPEMRGRAISDGPLPFLFGATANKLKQRYFMRVTTTAAEHAQGDIWIEAYPKFQRDAANFARAEIVLSSQKLSVRALKIVLPGGKQHTVHTFGKATINSPWRHLAPDFAKPKPPFGWEHVVERPSPAAAGSAGPPRSASVQRQPQRVGNVNAR